MSSPSPAVKGTSVWESVSPGKSTKQEDMVLPGHNDGAKIFMQSYSNYSIRAATANFW